MATWNYIKVFEDGTQVSTSIQPVFGETSTTADYYLDNIWYNNSGVAYTTTFTYLPYKVLIDEQLNVLDYDKFDIPTLVEDYVKADIVEGEHKGKNSCTAWCNFDGTTTPPTIRDSYNVSSVVRTATGVYDIYFEESMDNLNYSVLFGSGTLLPDTDVTVRGYRESSSSPRSLSKIRFSHVAVNASTNILENPKMACISFFGGKNA